MAHEPQAARRRGPVGRKPDGPLFLIDAGASHTRAVIARADGGILSRAAAGGSNLFAVGAAAADAQLTAAIRAALAGARLAAQSVAVAVIGSASVGYDGSDRRAVAAVLKRLLPRARLRILADVTLGLHAALKGEPGVVIVAGTGSIVLGRNRSGRLQNAGGWGWLLGDEGSGQWLGRHALAAAARGWDGAGPATALTGLVLRHLRVRSGSSLVTRVYRPLMSPAQFGALAPLVTRAAAAGDAVALALVREAAEALAAQTCSVIRRLRLEPAPVSYQGSVFTAGEVILAPLRRALRLEARRHGLRGVSLVPPALPPLAGAFLLALAEVGAPPSPVALAAFQADLAAHPASGAPARLGPTPRARSGRTPVVSADEKR